MKRLLSWGVPAILLFALIAWRFEIRSAANAAIGGQKKIGGNSPSVSVAQAVSRVIIQNLQSVANVESPFKVEISPKQAGRIAFLDAREGDRVTLGQVLLKIDPSDLYGAVLQQQASVAEAQARLAQAKITQDSTNVGITSQIQQQQATLNSAQANLNQVRQNYNAQIAGAEALVSAANSGIANAHANYDKEISSLHNIQTRFDRSTTLYKQGYIAAQDLDDARTAVEVQNSVVQSAAELEATAESQLKVQQQNLLITKRKGLSDIAASSALVVQAQAALRTARSNRSQTPAYKENIAALQSQVDAAEALLNQARARIADTVVLSPIAGTITARKSDPGGLASPGSPVLEVQFLDWLYVTATMPLELSEQIHVGDSAQITLDALPGRTFVGPITNLNPAADPQSRQIGMKVRLENSSHLLHPGMYGRVSITTGKVNAQVVVPREAIVTGLDGKSFVVVVDDKKVAHRRQVLLGAKDSRGTQVLSGVGLGETVVILTFNPLKDNQKVRIAAPGDTGSKSSPNGTADKKHSSQ